jgi:hypothetical protein
MKPLNHGLCSLHPWSKLFKYYWGKLYAQFDSVSPRVLSWGWYEMLPELANRQFNCSWHLGHPGLPRSPADPLLDHSKGISQSFEWCELDKSLMPAADTQNQVRIAYLSRQGPLLALTRLLQCAIIDWQKIFLAGRDRSYLWIWYYWEMRKGRPSSYLKW